MANDRRSPRDGKPYYCAVCGAGFGEYAACEMVYCKLESGEEAAVRKMEFELAETTAEVTAEAAELPAIDPSTCPEHCASQFPARGIYIGLLRS